MRKEVNRSSPPDPGWKSDKCGKLIPTSRSRGLAMQQIKLSDLVSTVSCNLPKTICYVLSLCQHAVELPNPLTFSNNIYSMYVWLQRDKTDTILSACVVGGQREPASTSKVHSVGTGTSAQQLSWVINPWRIFVSDKRRSKWHGAQLSKRELGVEALPMPPGTLTL